MRYSLTDLENMFGLTHQAVWKWVKTGKIKGYQLVDRGRWWVDESELQSHCEKMGLDFDQIKERLEGEK